MEFIELSYQAALYNSIKQNRLTYFRLNFMGIKTQIICSVRRKRKREKWRVGPLSHFRTFKHHLPSGNHMYCWNERHATLGISICCWTTSGTPSTTFQSQRYCINRCLMTACKQPGFSHSSLNTDTLTHLYVSNKKQSVEASEWYALGKNTPM